MSRKPDSGPEELTAAIEVRRLIGEGVRKMLEAVECMERRVAKAEADLASAGYEPAASPSDPHQAAADAANPMSVIVAGTIEIENKFNVIGRIGEIVSLEERRTLLAETRQLCGRLRKAIATLLPK